MTAGQAAYEAFTQDGTCYGWANVPNAVKAKWETTAAAARAWEPLPEPTLGEIAYRAFCNKISGVPLAAAAKPAIEQESIAGWQAAGEAAAAVGAAKERQAIRKLVNDMLLPGMVIKEPLLEAIDARDKPKD